MLSLLKPRDLTFEDVKDYRYAGVSSILMPSSKIFIGTQGRLDDASLYTANDLTFDFSNGVGDNGLDVGVEVSNQWYALYAVPKAGTSRYILKASIQSPHQAGGTGPTGFTKYRYLGLFRNGVNSWNTTANHLQGDICYFTKNKNSMNYTGFNDTNGGAFPLASTQTGIAVYVANTATNSILFDFDNLSSIGFSGASPYGYAKMPYRTGIYGFAHYINTSVNTCRVSITDAVINQRTNRSMVYDSDSNGFHGYFEMQPSPTNWQQTLRSVHTGNANVNRGLSLQRMVDQYTIGGI